MIVHGFYPKVLRKNNYSIMKTWSIYSCKVMEICLGHPVEKWENFLNDINKKMPKTKMTLIMLY